MSSVEDSVAQTEEKFRTFMGRYLVGLCGTLNDLVDGKPKGDERIFLCSGFVLVIGDTWCYTTAGHVLQDELIGGVERRLIRINRIGLADYWGPDPRVRDPIPFDFDGAPKLYLDNRDLGLDFALVVLREFYQESLRANGIHPIHRANWAGTENLDFEAYAMLGFPSELNTPVSRKGERTDQIGIEVRVPLVWIRRLTVAPDSLPPIPASWFIGQINVPFGIKGMSGGPIFGFRRNEEGRWEYRIVAIQSRWYSREQIILGCPVPYFMRLGEAKLEHTRQELGA